MPSSRLRIPSCPLPPPSVFLCTVALWFSKTAREFASIWSAVEAWAFMVWKQDKFYLQNSRVSKILFYFCMFHCCQLSVLSLQWDELWNSSEAAQEPRPLYFCFLSLQWTEFGKRGWVLGEIYKHTCVFGVMYSVSFFLLHGAGGDEGRLAAPLGTAFYLLNHFPWCQHCLWGFLQLCSLCFLHSLMTG